MTGDAGEIRSMGEGEAATDLTCVTAVSTGRSGVRGIGSTRFKDSEFSVFEGCRKSGKGSIASGIAAAEGDENSSLSPASEVEGALDINELASLLLTLDSGAV
jgi:hypothetical protein